MTKQQAPSESRTNRRSSPPDDAVWKALADPTRREILDLLATEPRTTGALVEGFPSLCRTAVMRHLEVLVQAGLVLVRREGRQRWNHLNPVPIQRVCERWVHRHVRGIASAMSRLKDHVEGRSPVSAPIADSPGGPTPPSPTSGSRS